MYRSIAWKSLKKKATLVDEDMVVTLSHLGYIKRNPLTQYRAQRRGGKGARGMKTRDEDFVRHLFVASTHAYLLFFTNRGRVHWLKVHEVPQLGRAAKGKALVNVLQLQNNERVQTMLPVRSFDDVEGDWDRTKMNTVDEVAEVIFSAVGADDGVTDLDVPPPANG